MRPTSKYVTYKTYEQLTREQAEFVDSRYPQGTDPWQYEYELLGEKVIDRFRLPQPIPVRAKEEVCQQ